MIDTVIVALISLVGTVLVNIISVLTSSKLMGYRIEQLEKKVDKHNTVIERTYKLEKDMSTAFIRIDEIREDLKEDKK